MYSITESGMNVLRQWIAEPTAEPVMHDEFALKMYSIWMLDKKQAKRLVEGRRRLYKNRLSELEDRVRKMEDAGNTENVVFVINNDI